MFSPEDNLVSTTHCTLASGWLLMLSMHTTLRVRSATG